MKMVLSIYQSLNSAYKLAPKVSKALEHNAHTLKGSVGIFSADTVYNLALKLEIMGRNNDMSGAREEYIVLEKEIEQLKLAFDLFRKDLMS